MLIRAILPDWAKSDTPSLKKVMEGDFDAAQIQKLNQQGYNIYYLPNYPSVYDPTETVDGSHIDKFTCVFVDMDLKEGKYADKDAFIATLSDFSLVPTKIVDSGNGIHVYWDVSDLDVMSYLRLQRRLMRQFNTDEAVAKIYQLMRYPGTFNTKTKNDFKLCELIFSGDSVYTCEQLDKYLLPITHEDEEYCKQHYEKTYNTANRSLEITDKIPNKFAKLLRESPEVKAIWSGVGVDDRSKADYRLGHIMQAYGFTRDEALSVLVNSAKAITRAPIHRINYAQSIVDKVWTFEEQQDSELNLSSSVKDILARSGSTLKGTRFPCWSYIDATEHGFRLGQIIGLVAGSGVGKTAMALNMFEGFVQNNPDYDHFFVSLEQPANEIADRWKTMCGERTHLHDKVHVLSNYGDDGSFRHLSLNEIREYLLKFQRNKQRKIGCVVIDHIGALKKQSKNGEFQGLMDICHEMKGFAVETNTMLVMQSQASREKAGIGDLELSKDAAYGTVFFESYCDYLVTIWQPLKRCYENEKCPKVTAFKFCKIRHKKAGVDNIQEDTSYRLLFDPSTEHMRELTEVEEKQFDFFQKQAINKRKQDRKTDIMSYHSIKWTKGAS